MLESILKILGKSVELSLAELEFRIRRYRARFCWWWVSLIGAKSETCTEPSAVAPDARVKFEGKFCKRTLKRWLISAQGLLETLG